MESLPDGRQVRLWSRAEEGGIGVAVRQRRAVLDAVLAIHRQHRFVRGGATYVILHAAALGRHLAQALEEAPPDQGARRPVQHAYDAYEQDHALGAEDGYGDGLMRHGAWRNLGRPTTMEAKHGQGTPVHDGPEQGDVGWEGASGHVLVRHRTCGGCRNFNNPSELPQWDAMGRRRRRGRASGSNNSQEEGERNEDPTTTPKSYSWESILGYPMAQTAPNTCALVAVTKCLEVQHRRVFEAIYGSGTFPCRAAAPRKLRVECFRDVTWDPFGDKRWKTWHPLKGAFLPRVLNKLMQLGGARTTNAPPPAPFFLPLADWTAYHVHEGLTPEVAARILHEQGPCVGSLFVTTEFFRNDNRVFGHRAPAIFRGCPRWKREEVKGKDSNAGKHAVVCYAYDHDKKGKLIISVLDNQSWGGPCRFVDFDTFDSFYVLSVQALPPRHLLGRSIPPVYPISGFLEVLLNQWLDIVKGDRVTNIHGH